MTSAREQVLARIRTAIGPDPADVPWPDVPEVGHDLPTEQRLALFVERVEDYRATVRVVPSTELATAIGEVLAGRGSRRVVVPAGLDVPLPDGTEVVTDDGQLGTRDLDACDAVVTRSAVGIAETGTIGLDASAGQGRRALTLVPDHHVCIVRETDIVETVPEGLARLATRRPVTLISGPSATSDIELSRVEGVHGPRLLDVIVEQA